MAVARESVYHCTFASSSRLVTRRILAWDAREALESFREVLQRDRPIGRGRFQVTGPDLGPGARATARRRAAVTVS